MDESRTGNIVDGLHSNETSPDDVNVSNDSTSSPENMVTAGTELTPRTDAETPIDLDNVLEGTQDVINGEVEKSEKNGSQIIISTSDDSPGDKSEHNDTNDSSEDSDESEDEETDDDEDESPPKLKYSRLNQLLSNFFTKDPISTCAFHDNILIFATHTGILHLVRPDYSVLRTFKAHRASILLVFTDGLYFASASMDGTIVIGSIGDEKDIIAYDFSRPVHAVVFDKTYARSKSFISGGMSGKVIYSTKNWLGQRVDTILEEGHGPIVCIKIIDDIVFWMNDKGITFFDISNRQTIHVIEKPEDSPRGDLYWPRVHIPEANRILVAWGNYVWSLVVQSGKLNEDNNGLQNNSAGAASSLYKVLPSTATISFRTSIVKKVEVEHVFKFDALICGISTFTNDSLLLLVFNPPTILEGEMTPTYNNPDVRLVNATTGELEFEEEIGLKNVKGLGLNDYKLGTLINKSPKYFIVSATDGVVAEQVLLYDQLQWFISKDRYLDAWRVTEHLLPRLKRLNLGILHVDSLVSQEKWEEAATFLGSILEVEYSDLPDNYTTLSSVSTEEMDIYIREVITQWDAWSRIFIETGHVGQIATVVPTSPKLNLPKHIFNHILEHYLKTDQDEFVRLLKSWSLDLFDYKSIETKLEEELEAKASNTELRIALSDLYVSSYEPSKSVPHLTFLKVPTIIQFLFKHHLLTTYKDKLPEFIILRFKNREDFESQPIPKLEEKLGDIIDIFVDSRHELLPAEIVDLFVTSRMDVVNYFYLQKLKAVDDFLVQTFGNELVKLYAEFDKTKLIGFLSSNNNYEIEMAIELCETNEYIPELVYLLGKIGENKKALRLMIEKLDDPETAINFAKHQNDKETWTILIDHSMDKPKFIKALIEDADELLSQFYDPIDVLQRMSNNIEVWGLNNSIIKFSYNNELNLVLNQLIYRLVLKNTEELSHYLRLDRIRGFEIHVQKLIHDGILSESECIIILRDSKAQGEVVYLNESSLVDSIYNETFTTLSAKYDHIVRVRHHFHQKD